MVNRLTVELTEQVRRATDIVELVSAYASLKRAGRQFKGLCPFHQEKSPSFHVCPERQIFKCFGCGVGGDAFKFIQLRENVNFPEARRILAAKAGIELREERSGLSSPGEDKSDLERVNRWAAAWFQQQLAGAAGGAAREYVQSRGLSDQTVHKFAVGFAPDGWSNLHNAAMAKGIPVPLLFAAGLIKRREDGSSHYDAFRNRLMFPIHDVMDRVIAFGGRTLGDDPAKYLNSPQTALFDKSRCLYGLSAAKHGFRERRRAVVVEGYVDCLMAHQHGFAETVATLGTALTLEHVQMLHRYVDEVVLLFDADAAGQRATNQSLPLFFTSDVHVRLAQVPEGKDPADLLVLRGAEALETALTSAVGALESKWNQVVQRCRGDARGPDMRRAVEEFLGLIGQSAGFGTCDPIQRGLLANQIGKLLGLSSEEVHRQLRAMTRRAPDAPVSAAGGVSQPVGGSSAVGSAMRDLLEVMLNEPSYYESVRTEFTPELFADEALRAIALEACRLCEEQGGFELADLLSRFESVEIGRQIVDLHMAGERGGNFAARIEGAVTTLQKARDRVRVGSLMAELRGSSGTESSSPRAAGEAARRLSHFAARRHMTATPVTVGAAPSAPPSAE